jgi:hypothetical protein
LAVSACGEDAGSEGAAAGSGGIQIGGSSSTSGKGGSSSGDKAGSAGTSSGGGNQSAAGESSGTSGTNPGGSGTGNVNGTGGETAAGGAGVGEPPGPAPGGGSVYAVECSGDTAMCGVERSHCLGINVGDGKIGYSCSNHCNTLDDCSDAPSGAEAAAGCVQFKAEKRCVLVCYDQPNEYACPDGMSCYIYPNSPIGYCLWLK